MSAAKRAHIEPAVSFVPVTPECDFPIQNIPFGVFRPAVEGAKPRIGTAIGEFAVDVAALATKGFFAAEHVDALLQVQFLLPFLSIACHSR
jgi:hypothetical protein